jgi:hypothetical protein
MGLIKTARKIYTIAIVIVLAYLSHFVYQYTKNASTISTGSLVSSPVPMSPIMVKVLVVMALMGIFFFIFKDEPDIIEPLPNPYESKYAEKEEENKQWRERFESFKNHSSENQRDLQTLIQRQHEHIAHQTTAYKQQQEDLHWAMQGKDPVKMRAAQQAALAATQAAPEGKIPANEATLKQRALAMREQHKTENRQNTVNEIASSYHFDIPVQNRAPVGATGRPMFVNSGGDNENDGNNDGEGGFGGSGARNDKNIQYPMFRNGGMNGGMNGGNDRDDMSPDSIQFQQKNNFEQNGDENEHEHSSDSHLELDRELTQQFKGSANVMERPMGNFTKNVGKTDKINYDKEVTDYKSQMQKEITLGATPSGNKRVANGAPSKVPNFLKSIKTKEN